jgi:hypothetical protein
MIYKAAGMENPLPFGGPVIHLAARSKHPDGPFEKLPKKLFCCEGAAFPFEDPFVWHQNGSYYALLKDMNCHTHTPARSLTLFQSANGSDWSLAKNSLVSDRTIRFEDGSVKTFDRLERPQMYLENGTPAVLFCAAEDGDKTCNIQIPLITSVRLF